MKLLGQLENKKGNKLIFKSDTSDIPALGSIALQEKKQQQAKGKNYDEIGKIIDVFGPVKNPWIVVHLRNEKLSIDQSNTFYWNKTSSFKKDYKNKKNYGSKSNKPTFPKRSMRKRD